MSATLDIGFLASTYRQYKKDTEYIAGWLVETAKIVGFRLNKVEPSVPVESLRLKGKARKEAKEAARARLGAQNSGSEHHIRASDFVPIAEAIAAQPKKVKVPSALLTLFGRAIKARKQAQAWYKSAKLEDEGHSHFIQILARVQGILRPLVPSAKAPSKAKAASSKSEGIENRFSKLTVEEAADTASNGEADLVAKLTPVVLAEIEQSEDELEEEFFFAIHLFLKGIHEIQDVVQEAWFKRQDFDMDPMNAALLANTAIDLVRRAEGEFDLLLKRPTKYPANKFPVWSLPALLYYHYHPFPDDVNIRDVVLPTNVNIKVEEKSYDKLHANWCFWPVYTGLRFCVNSVKKSKFVLANEEELASIGSKTVKDIKRTYDLAKEFRIYTSAYNRFWAQDEVTRGMKLMFTKSEIPIWVTFGMQILLDIQDIMDYSMGEGKGFNLPYNHARTILDNVMVNWKESGEWEPPFPWLFGKDSNSEDARFICNDAMDRYHDLLEHQDIPAVEFNPIRCGLLKYDVYSMLHEYGQRLEHYGGFASVLAHVYNAGKLLYPNDPAWPDMEYLLSQQDPNYIFYGGLPKSLHEADRKCYLAFGQKMKPANHEKKRFAFNNVTRTFRETSLLNPVLSPRMTGWNDHTTESVDKLANSLNTILCDEASRDRLARQLAASREWVESNISFRRTMRLFEDIPAQGPPVLLRDLSLFLEGELQEVLYDWVSLYRICGDIWKDILAELSSDPKLEQHMENPGLGYQVLRLAAEDEAKHGKILVDNPDFAPQLRKVWRCIQNAIQKQSPRTFPHPTEAGSKGWFGDDCLGELMARNHMSTVWQLMDSNCGMLLEFYENWEDTLLEAGVINQVCGRYQYNELAHRRQISLLTGGLARPCTYHENYDDPTSNNHCGRCNRRNFFLDRYGTVSSLQGTKLAEGQLGRKYHGKDEEVVDEEEAELKAHLREFFESQGIPFYDGDNGEG
ncbi:hypothetical protein P171DRAFT_434127 [Karstenula rhodostoma CBS 690.94]|uniref:DUF6604 domain-containing protein n=1 Tax=Karstenula rhodostoma CBS 690.94 TaxID=1392251 RepID=A0A9P4U8Z3_9PLEO|nr:hypothetical protein P171DRAFT_434127 [Karstenula rhodostoma CBS 690.94]